jgi:hypothetical protein
MDDPTDHPPVVHPARAGLVPGQKRLNRRPRPIRKPIPACHRSAPAPFLQNESEVETYFNRLIGF